MGFLSDLLGKAADTTYQSVEGAISHYLSKNPNLAETLDRHDATIAISSLPAEYDNTPYQTIVNGHMVHTVGEYKAECAKFQSWD